MLFGSHGRVTTKSSDLIMIKSTWCMNRLIANLAAFQIQHLPQRRKNPNFRTHKDVSEVLESVISE